MSAGENSKPKLATNSGRERIAWPAGAALVVGNMVGVGVFTSLGWQLASAPSGFAVLLLWVLGGIYALSGAESPPSEEVRFAVNLAAGESRTDPLENELLEAAGVKLARDESQASDTGAADRERQLQNRELERQQKLWRWLIVAAVLVLVVETLLSGRLSMKRTVAAE